MFQALVHFNVPKSLFRLASECSGIIATTYGSPQTNMIKMCTLHYIINPLVNFPGKSKEVNKHGHKYYPTSPKSC